MINLTPRLTHALALRALAEWRVDRSHRGCRVMLQSTFTHKIKVRRKMSNQMWSSRMA